MTNHNSEEKTDCMNFFHLSKLRYVINIRKIQMPDIWHLHSNQEMLNCS